MVCFAKYFLTIIIRCVALVGNNDRYSLHLYSYVHTSKKEIGDLKIVTVGDQVTEGSAIEIPSDSR